MKCQNCGAENPAEYKFCNKCGTALSVTSPDNSDTEVKVKVRFCPKCGEVVPFHVWNCLKCGETLGIDTVREVRASEVKYYEEIDPSKDILHTMKDRVTPHEPLEKSISGLIYHQSDYGTNRRSTIRDDSSNGYGALRGIASLCRTLSNIAVGIAGIGAFVCLFLIFDGDTVLFGLGGILLCAIIGGFFYVIFRIIAEGVSVFLEIEVNTSRTCLL